MNKRVGVHLFPEATCKFRDSSLVGLCCWLAESLGSGDEKWAVVPTVNKPPPGQPTLPFQLVVPY